MEYESGRLWDAEILLQCYGTVYILKTKQITVIVEVFHSKEKSPFKSGDQTPKPNSTDSPVLDFCNNLPGLFNSCRIYFTVY